MVSASGWLSVVFDPAMAAIGATLPFAVDSNATTLAASRFAANIRNPPCSGTAWGRDWAAALGTNGPVAVWPAQPPRPATIARAGMQRRQRVDANMIAPQRKKGFESTGSS
jgi:hypothetical protein